MATYFAWSLLLTGMLAFLSYRLVEAPCLRSKNVRIADLQRGHSAQSRPAIIVEPGAVAAVPVNS